MSDTSGTAAGPQHRTHGAHLGDDSFDDEESDVDRAPGDEPHSEAEVAKGLRGYLFGMALAVALTAASFFTLGTDLVWGPGIPVALIVFAIAQMGVHLVFFLHITTGADNTNNVMALAFGVLIVILLIAGSIWIMANLDANMLPMEQLMKMQR